jgi:hypothetical protein
VQTPDLVGWGVNFFFFRRVTESSLQNLFCVTASFLQNLFCVIASFVENVFRTELA